MSRAATQDIATYDAYGQRINSTGSTENAYRFAGEQFDSHVGQYYLRARYYDAGVGRFTGRDPFEGEMMVPLSLAKYPYVHGNPVNAIDPSGLVGDEDTKVAPVVETSILTRVVPASFSFAGIGGAIVGGGVAGVAVTAAVPAAVNISKGVTQIATNIDAVLARGLATIATLLSEIPFVEGFPSIEWGDELPETTEHTYEALHGLGNGFILPIGIASPFLGRISQGGWGRG